jgi:hypothetical protein
VGAASGLGSILRFVLRNAKFLRPDSSAKGKNLQEILYLHSVPPHMRVKPLTVENYRNFLGALRDGKPVPSSLKKSDIEQMIRLARDEDISPLRHYLEVHAGQLGPSTRAALLQHLMTRAEFLEHLSHLFF